MESGATPEHEMSPTSLGQPWLVRKDLDGFFGLMIDNLIQLILIVSLCRELIGRARVGIDMLSSPT